MESIYVIQLRSEITLSREQLSEARQLAEDADALVASDIDWMLLQCSFDLASQVANLLYTHPMLARAGQYLNAGGQDFYVDDNGVLVDSALAVLDSLAQNGNADAQSFFEQYADDAQADYAQEILGVMSRSW